MANDLFDSSREAFDGTSNLRLKGGIVGIWGKLAYDVIIRDNLIEYQGFSITHLANTISTDTPS